MTLFLDSRKATARINASLENSISGIRTTKAFTNSAAEEEKFEESNKEFVSARSRAYDAMGRFFLIDQIRDRCLMSSC